MSKVVAHMGKMKAGNLSGIQKHNERLNNTYSNDLIDVSRSHLNYDLVKNSDLTYKEMVDKHIAENIVLKRALRKDAVLVNEWIISSEKKFFDKLNDQQTREFFQTAVDYFNEKCGNHVVYATVHLDENTPHMHLGVVPIIDGKLSSKKLFGRKMLREIQDELPERLKSKGFEIERGILGSEQKHLSVKEYKANKKAVKEMSEEINDLNVVKTHLESRTDVLKEKVSNYKREVSKLLTEQNRLQKSISEQKDEKSKLNVAIGEMKIDLMTVSEDVEDINHRVAVAWHDDWLATKSQFPDFNMKTTITEQYEDSYVENGETFIQEVEIEVNVDENTPKTYNFDFRRTLELFNEKVEGFVSYLKEKALEFKNKALELLDKKEQLEDREKALNMREVDIDKNLAEREREIDKKLEKVTNSEVLLAENAVKLERIDKMIASRNEVLVNVNKEWSVNQSQLINQLGWIADNAQEKRLGKGWIVDESAVRVIKEAKNHLETTNPVTLMKANQEITQSYNELKQELQTDTAMDMRVAVAKKQKEMQDEIRDLRSEVFDKDGENLAYIRMITNLVRDTDQHEYAYELQYALGKTFYAESEHLSDTSKEKILDKLLDASTKGFFEGYQQAEKNFEMERAEEINRQKNFNRGRDWGGMSL